MMKTFKKMTKNSITLEIRDEDLPKRLNAYQIEQCYKLVGLMGKNIKHTGTQLAYMMKVEKDELRHIIMRLRREFIMFQNPSGKLFLVADQEGY